MLEAKRKSSIWKKGCIAILAIAVVTGCAFGAYVLLQKDSYDEYDTYAKNSKKVGEMKHGVEDKEDVYHLSEYYPVFSIKELDKVVTNYRKENMLKNYKHNGMYFLNIDYDSKKIYDSYIVLTFKRTIKDEKKKVVDEKITRYNFDIKKNKVMSVRDVLRRNYIDMLQKKAKDAGIKQASITSKNLNDFLIQKGRVTFYIDNKTIDITYRDHKEYIALTNKNIPSLYQKDAVIPKTQKIDPNKKMIAITFDDGPHGKNTDIIMNEFEKYDGRATFFMLGQNIGYYESIVKDVYARGFELGNHSWDHSERIAASKNNYMTKDEVAQELYKTQDALFKAAGSEAMYFRPPFGELNKNVKEVSTMDFALWSIDTLDWQNHNPDKITEIINTNVRDGSIILLHDIHDTSMEAVKKFLPILNEQGYQFVTLSELMQYKGEQAIKDDNVLIAEYNK